MDQSWINRWDERYREKEFAYGEEPNTYLREQLAKLDPAKILFPAEGEGRNAVYAARAGWDVSAFDISTEGRKKAMALAARNNVHIDYRTGGLDEVNFGSGEFDVIALIYAHFPANIKSQYHKALDNYLRPGGYIIFEAFSKKHLDYLAKNEKVGGPRELAMLFSVDELKADFQSYSFMELAETEVELHEGNYHNGIGSVIRCVAQKNGRYSNLGEA
jgi:hypothetical protein